LTGCQPLLALCFFRSSTSAGTAWNRSATRP